MGSNELRDSDELDRLVTEYVERLNAGDRVDPAEILLRHPRQGEEILAQLELFVGAMPNGHGREPEPLGSLGDYTLRRQIGRGGMGVVYEAWENSMDRAVALKVLPAGVAADDRAFQRFMQEAKAAGKLSHPNVVPVYFTGMKEQTPFYAMEYVEGETLARVLARIKDAEPETDTPFGPKDQVDYFAKLARAFADVADGLQHAHSRGVTHRDIKPSNLILDSEVDLGGRAKGRLRILDFGLARLEGQESLTLSGDFVGTPLYMSPEQARRKKIPVDHRTDVYSLGATMYEAICGRPPFRGRDHADTLSQIIERDPVEPRKLNPRVPRDLETIVLKCLRKASGDRYGTAEALSQDLHRFLRGDPIEARTLSGWERFSRVAWQRRRAIAVAPLLILLIGTLALLFYGYRAQRSVADLARYTEIVRASLVKILAVEMTTELPANLRRHLSLEDRRILWSTAGTEHLEAAIDDLGAAAALLPERPEAYYHRARGLLLLGRVEDARREVGVALEVDPSFVPAVVLLAGNRGTSPDGGSLAMGGWRGIWGRLHRACQEKRWGDAESLYSRLVDLERRGRPFYLGASMDFRMGRGVARLESGDYPGAVEDFAFARERWPNYLEFAILLGKAWYLSGNEEHAENIFSSLLRERAEAVDEVRAWVSTVYRSVRDLELALEWTAEMAESPIRERLRLDYLFNLHRYDEAIASGRKAVALNDRDVFSTCMLAVAIIFRDMFDPLNAEEVIRLGERALTLERDNFLAYMVVATGLRAQGEYEKAVELYREVEAMRPHWHEVHTCLGLTWQLMGNRAEAEKELHEAIRLAPEVGNTWNFFAGILLDQGRVAEALEAYRKAVELDPRHPFPHYNIGRIFKRRGKVEESLDWYSQAVARGPSLFWPHLHLGSALLELGRHDEALAEFQESEQLRPRSPWPHYCRSLLFGRQGQWNRAIESLRSAIERDGMLDETHEELVELVRLGESPIRDEMLSRIEERIRAATDFRAGME